MFNRIETVKPQSVAVPPDDYLDYLEWRVARLRADFETYRTRSAFEEWKSWERSYRKALAADPDRGAAAAVSNVQKFNPSYRVFNEQTVSFRGGVHDLARRWAAAEIEKE